MYEIVKTVALVFLIAFLIRYFLIQPFVIEGYSMEPNFHNNEYILVDMISYHFKQPQRGDIIVFKFPQKPSVSYIKRIIGIPEDCIEVKGGQTYLNDHLLDESYLAANTPTLVGGQNGLDYKKCLGSNDFFVMGDNREHSSDSREWGVVPRSNIIGKTWLIIYPIQFFGFIKHPNLTTGLYSILPQVPALNLHQS